jgi:hypothetical protein
MIAGEWGSDYTPIAPLIVDDFESYADTTAMEVKWSDRFAGPTGCGNILTLLTDANDCHQGTKALQWDYDLSCIFATGTCEILYDANSSPIDLSQYDEMSVWLKRHTDNSQEYLFYVQYLNAYPDTNGVVTGEKWIYKKDGSTWSEPNEWTELVIDLHDLRYMPYSESLGYDELSDINDVRGIVFGVYSSLHNEDVGDMDEGTIDIDDIELRVVPPCPVQLEGDTNNDCDVDIEDLAALVDTWLDCTDPYEEGCVDVR